MSSNMIERIEHLNPLRFLRKLDLSANRIRVISGLRGLYNLEEVNLSGNKIVSLANLTQIQGENYKLKHIDLSGKHNFYVDLTSFRQQFDGS